MPSDGHSFVYVISGPGAVKIGSTRNLKQRLSALQTSSPTKLSGLFCGQCSVPNARLVEMAAHKELSADRLAGEWFGATPEAAISAIRVAAQALSVSFDEMPFPMKVKRFIQPAVIQKGYCADNLIADMAACSLTVASLTSLLARASGRRVAPSTVPRWRNRERKCPASLALLMAMLTGRCVIEPRYPAPEL